MNYTYGSGVVCLNGDKIHALDLAIPALTRMRKLGRKPMLTHLL